MADHSPGTLRLGWPSSTASLSLGVILTSTSSERPSSPPHPTPPHPTPPHSKPAPVLTLTANWASLYGTSHD